MITIPDSARWAAIQRNALHGHRLTARALGVSVDDLARAIAGIPVRESAARALLGALAAERAK